MKTIEIKVTERTVHEWNVALAAAFKRRTGKAPKQEIKLEKLIEMAIYDAVAREFQLQAEEAEARIE
jgi:hypothetical protein